MKEAPFISCPIGSDDYYLFKSIVNQGIDSHFEAFTLSRFEENGSRFDFFFHDDEMSILLRRLSEVGDDDAECWENDILDVEYGIEVV